MRIISLEKSHTKMWYRNYLQPLSKKKNQNWVYLWIGSIKFYTFCICCMSSWRLSNLLKISFTPLAFFFFSIWVFFHNHSRLTRLQGKGEGTCITPRYHFHPLHRHLDISRAINAESSPLYIGSSCTRTGNLWFPSYHLLLPHT